MIVHILNSPEGTRCDGFVDHYNPSIATTVARTVDRDRVLALNEESLNTYFDDLEHCKRRNKILPDMWSFDEKAL